MEHTRSNIGIAVAAAAALLLLGGCDRQEPKSFSQKADQSAAKLAGKTGEAATTVAMAADDAAITTKVKTALLAEPGLKSLLADPHVFTVLCEANTARRMAALPLNSFLRVT